ncbi:hypothetical protein [Paraburkholderia sp. J10-1]|uniref:defense against restriction DarA-related protein n=1 Tax=Paraburkholderia sp. J10-1 TaxID=2805430 RepID=UPI002AB7E5A9|nr:hypothetical protein [Paraburkholderia sp. J10-1]
MAEKNLVFDFFNLSNKDAAIKKASRYFLRAGATVASVDVLPTVKRLAGVEYREVQFGFADSQTVLVGVTATGDVGQVKLNSKALPIKAQDDHVAAISEIVGAMDRGRKRFQAALTRVKVALPPSIRTAAPKIEQELRERIAVVDEAIEGAKQRVVVLEAQVAQAA